MDPKQDNFERTTFFVCRPLVGLLIQVKLLQISHRAECGARLHVLKIFLRFVLFYRNYLTFLLPIFDGDSYGPSR